MRKAEDITGQEFGELTALRRNGSRNGRAVWTCKCSCGRECDVIKSRLTGKHTKSCGHLRNGRPRRNRTTTTISDKVCNGNCKELKPVGEFTKSTISLDGYQPWCRACVAKYKRNWKEIPAARAAVLWGLVNRRSDATPAKIERTTMILEAGYCEATGIAFDLTMGDGFKWNGPTIDQIVPAAGYHDGNWQVVIKAYNTGKSNWGEDKILLVADGIRRNKYEG